MKLGILGAGKIVRDLLTIVHSLDFESISILGTDRNRNETEALAKQYKLAAVYFEFEEMLLSDVDTIYVALPNHLHYAYARQSIINGKHLIIEKPITTTLEELKKLNSLAEKHGVILLEAINIHYLPAYRALKKEVSKLGEMKMISLNYSQYSSRYDAFKSGEVHPAFDFNKAGGALMDINIYNINFIVGIYGRPRLVQYYPNISNGVDTSGILVLDYSTFKCVCIGAKDCHSSSISTLQGDGGTLQINNAVNNISSYEFKSIHMESVTHDFADGQHRLYHAFKSFSQMIQNRDFSSATKMLEASFITMEIIENAKKTVTESF
ncbi:Gfo/Idh/MocA family oxidoreductase [Kluyvera sp. STS39-E]|uniref:Gfo/Idh/MocA family protein n=1 Tax=Enterobacteriaceae TaxID=543 RepID=UPI000E3C4D93|nr:MULTISPECIES: Gfo/Idh/MocA family oxidoreductase [Citrobacter]MBD0826585.1 Gfo/Idh/MocA family oxidoreductase [Citrobacter sp. C1]RFU93310.1 gfo/Idh/MocA family oxidoreductase [Citrobacter gillenii]